MKEIATLTIDPAPDCCIECPLMAACKDGDVGCKHPKFFDLVSLQLPLIANRYDRPDWCPLVITEVKE